MDIRTLRVAAHPFNYKGATLPQGAIFGSDKRSPLFCVDYKIKSVSNTGKVALTVYRYQNGEWHSKIEATETTEAIIDLYFDRESACQIKGVLEIARKGSAHIQSFHIAKAFGIKWNDFNLPKGAIFGTDDFGEFIVKDFAVKGYKRGFPALKVWRVKDDQGNYIRWQCAIEAHETTQCVLYYCEKHDHWACEYQDSTKKICPQVRKSEWGETHYTHSGMFATHSGSTQFDLPVKAQPTFGEMIEKWDENSRKALKLKPRY